jgi:hypothetical protein
MPLPLEAKYYSLGIVDGLLGRMGKRYAPENFVAFGCEASAGDVSQ